MHWADRVDALFPTVAIPSDCGALRIPMKKLIVSAAFLFAIAVANQAAACDMGAIEAWVAAACHGNGCETKSTTENPP